MPELLPDTARSRLMENPGDTTQFSALDQQTDPRFFIQYLDAGNALADIKQLKQVMITQLELRNGLHLLDVGCGTGDDVRALAQIVGARGRSVGVDASVVMIAEAQRRHATSGLSVAFVTGDAQHLVFADATFDREEKIIGIREGTDGVADQVHWIVHPLAKQTQLALFFDRDAVPLLNICALLSLPGREGSTSVQVCVTAGLLVHTQGRGL
jgi:SAM-dependent methyltransferase